VLQDPFGEAERDKDVRRLFQGEVEERGRDYAPCQAAICPGAVQFASAAHAAASVACVARPASRDRLISEAMA
jgi:hypothetical protein